MPFNLRAALSFTAAIIALLVTLLLDGVMMSLQIEGFDKDLGETSTSLLPGETLRLPESYRDSESAVLDEDWVLKGEVTVSGPKALLAVGLVDEIENLTSYLEEGGSPWGLKAREGLTIYYLENETFNLNIRVKVQGQYMLAVHNTLRPKDAQNFTRGGRLDLQARFYAHNSAMDPSKEALIKDIVAFLLGVSTFLTAIFFLLYSAHRQLQERVLNFVMILIRYTYHVAILLLLSGVAALTTLVRHGACSIYPFFLLGIIIYSLVIPRRESKPRGQLLQLQQMRTPPPEEATAVWTELQTEASGDTITLHLTISNRSSTRLESVEITPVLPPEQYSYELGKEYLVWIEPGEKAQVDFVLSKYDMKRGRVPIHFRISYTANRRRVEHTTGTYYIDV